MLRFRTCCTKYRTLGDTFSDVKGHYKFIDLIPGAYEVKINSEDLPRRHVMASSAIYYIGVNPGETLIEKDFGIMEKKRKIVTTFSNKPGGKQEKAFVLKSQRVCTKD